MFIKGQKHTIQHILNLKKNHIGMLGQKQSESTKEKIRKSLLGRKFSEERKLKISIAKKGKPSNRKNVNHSIETKQKISINTRIAMNNKALRNKLSNIKKELYLNHPEKHSNYIMAQKGFISKPQKELYITVLEKYNEAELEYPIRTKLGIKFIDVAVPSRKLAFEFDGEYWHKGNEQYDKIREDAIISEGWIVIRFNYSNLINA